MNKNHGRIETRRCWVMGDQVTSETRYYLSSLPADAQLLLQYVRSHWGIENALHCVLDMAFQEDESRIRTGQAAHNMSILRRLASMLANISSHRRPPVATDRAQQTVLQSRSGPPRPYSSWPEQPP